MQILEIWNDLFTKGLVIHCSFYQIWFLFFVNFRKNQSLMPIYTNFMKFKFKCNKPLSFENLFHPTS
jgi:hypothetical protein